MLLAMLLMPAPVAQEEFAFSHLQMPVFGTLYKGKLYGLFEEKEPMPICLHTLDLKKNGARAHDEAILVRVLGSYHRCRVRYGRMWLSVGYPFIKSMSFEDLAIFSPRGDGKQWDAYLKKYGRTDADPDPGLIDLPVLEEKKIRSGFTLKRFRDFAGLAIVPTSENTLKTFLLLAGKSDMEIWDSEARFDKKTMTWETVADGKNLTKLESAFKEDFYAFIHKDTYYFVTESGKLYSAAPPKKGEKQRTMKGKWEFPETPIVCVIEDADNDRVWLFAKNKAKDAKRDYYFDLTGTSDPRPFERAKLAPVNVEGRAKMVLEYLPLIYADKKKEK